MPRQTPPQRQPSNTQRVVLYVRVSSLKGRAGDDFHSPSVQTDGMRRLISQDTTLREVDIVDDDIDVSGQTFDRRGIARIRAMVEAATVDIVAVYTLSRIGRNLADALTFIRWLRDRGVRIISATEKIDETAAGQFMVAMFLNMAELQGNQIAESWRRVIERRARTGRAHGRAKHGYAKAPDGRYVIDPTLGPAITEMFTAYARGDQISAIAAAYSRARGKPVAKTQVKAMLRDPVYRGRVVVNSTVGGVIDVPDAHPALVDETTWRLVQRRMDIDKSTPPRHLEPAYSLTGLGVCPYCKHNLQIMHSRDRTTGELVRRLQCTHKRQTASCDGIGTPLYAPIEAAVVRKVAEHTALLRGDPGARAEQEARTAQAGMDARILERELARTREAMGRLTERWARGAIPDDAYDRALANLTESEETQSAALEVAQDLVDAPPVAQMVVLVERVLELWPEMTEAERNRGLRTVLRRFTVRRREFWMEPEGDRVGDFDFRW